MHTIIHIGAGQGDDLLEWVETGAEHIVLVEPNPELAQKLEYRASPYSQVTVLQAAITSSFNNNQLKEYNLKEANSLYVASGLQMLFPGLKVVATHTVTTLSIDDLMSEYSPQVGKKALLVIQAPGEEHAIIQDLINTGRLKDFSKLYLNLNPIPYYQGSVAAESTLQALIDYDFQITDKDQQDPDWPIWQLCRNPLMEQVNFLKKENQRLKSIIQHLEMPLERKDRKMQKPEDGTKQRQYDFTHQKNGFEKPLRNEIPKTGAEQFEQELKSSQHFKVEVEEGCSEQQQLQVVKRSVQPIRNSKKE